MYDTISIKSPCISDLDYNEIRQAVKRVESIDLTTGEVNWQLTTCDILGSYDSRIIVKFGAMNSITITGSPHKFIMGHNVYGGPVKIKKCCKYLVMLVSKKLGLSLPSWRKWELMRADITYNFKLSSKEEVEEFFKMMRGCTYPRRQPANFGVNSVYFKGVSTTLKAYNKGPEFRIHDKPRLEKLIRNGMYNGNIKELIDIGNRIVRFECEVRKRKLKYDKINNRCSTLKDKYFKKVYKNEVNKVLKEGESEMEIVRDINGVKNRLNSIFPKRKARNLFAVWSRIQMESERTVKNSVCKKTWHNYKNDFASAGVSMKGSVKVLPLLEVVGSNILNNFVPLPNSPYCMNEDLCNIDKEIKELEKIA